MIREARLSEETAVPSRMASASDADRRSSTSGSSRPSSSAWLVSKLEI